jgi:hypothetical protein
MGGQQLRENDRRATKVWANGNTGDCAGREGNGKEGMFLYDRGDLEDSVSV